MSKLNVSCYLSKYVYWKSYECVCGEGKQNFTQKSTVPEKASGFRGYDTDAITDFQEYTQEHS